MQDRHIHRYTVPLSTPVKIVELPPINIDGLVLRFDTDDDSRIARSIIVETFVPKRASSAQRTLMSGGYVEEPASDRVEGILLRLADFISLLSGIYVEFLFEKRTLEFLRVEPTGATLLSSIKVDFGGEAGLSWENNIGEYEFYRSLLASVCGEGLDASVSFYNRAFRDLNNNRYIESFYNYFFFLEYLFGNGKSGRKAFLSELNKSKIVLSACTSLLNGTLLEGMVSPDILNFSESELLEHFYDVRGRLHHPNSRRGEDWHPSKQRELRDSTLALSGVCMKIVLERAGVALFSDPRVERGIKSIIRSVRLGKPIRVITR